MRKLIFISILTLLLWDQSLGQDVRKLVNEQMEVAKSQMNEGNYEAANKTFRKILSMKTVLPHDLSYLFAETLYMVGQYENSDNFLKRYIQITGMGGNYAVQAEQLRSLLKNKLKQIAECSYCDLQGYRLVTCSHCNGEKYISDVCPRCKGHGGFKCHVCLGEGVLIEETDFATKEYKTCTLCHGKGIEICPVCNGEKIINQKCPVCLGSGLESSRVICDHTPPTLH